jgi:hypothetical protein
MCCAVVCVCRYLFAFLLACMDAIYVVCMVGLDGVGKK